MGRTKNTKEINFQKLIKVIWKWENWKWPLVNLTSDISASTWPNIKSKDSFEILRTSRFHNLPYFLNVVKIWWRYCLKTNRQVFLWTCITMTRNWRFRGTKPKFGSFFGVIKSDQLVICLKYTKLNNSSQKNQHFIWNWTRSP